MKRERAREGKEGDWWQRKGIEGFRMVRGRVTRQGKEGRGERRYTRSYRGMAG